MYLRLTASFLAVMYGSVELSAEDLVPPPPPPAVGAEVAAETPVDPAPVAPPTGANAEALRVQADTKAATGRTFLQTYRKDMQGNPNAVVDAAVVFSEAHKLYEQLGDTDAVSEMQANVFWCKKQMNLDAVKVYLGRQGKTEALASLTAEERKVEVSEGQAYLDRAKKFAADRPDDLNSISIRYFEVAQKFVGTPIGLEAQKLSLDAQEKYGQWLAAGGSMRETRFTKKTSVRVGKQVEIPDDKSQKAALAELKKLYVKDYARKTDGQKRRFAAKLSDEAGRSKGDATVYFVSLQEVCRLAQEGEDYPRLLDTIDLLGASFKGYDATAERRTWIKKMGTKSAAVAIVTLMDKPTDPAANAVAGKFFCLTLKRWSEGLPMLALSTEGDLKALAEQELAKPADDDQRVQIGDAWYALAKKTGAANEKNPMLARAQYWYQQTKELSGVPKERTNQRLVEIDKALPLDMDNIDWTSLTPSQWAKLKGATKVIEVGPGRSGPMMSLKPGERIRIVPNPTDSWTCQSWGGKITTTWSGVDSSRERVSGNGRNRGNEDLLLFSSFSAPYSNFRFGELLFQVEQGDMQSCGIAAGPGRLWMIPNRPGGDCKGQIRVKFVAVDDE